MISRIALCAAVVGATLLVADDAFAKGGKNRNKNRPQTVELTRPSDSPDPDATGTVTVTRGARGESTVIKLKHLKPRTVFEVRDADTGDALGNVKTNRKGAATFNLTKSLAKAASAGGSSSSDPQNVDIVDPTTGDSVLTGDVTPPAPVAQEGYDDYSDDAGDFASVYMATDPDLAADTFSLTFFPAVDPTSTSDKQSSVYYDLNLDTSNGDKLPLDAATVADLAGRAFEIHSADGSVVLSGDLPALEPIDDANSGDGTDDGSGDDWSGDWGSDWTGDSGSNWWGDWGSNWCGDWTDPTQGCWNYDGASQGDGGSTSDPAGDGTQRQGAAKSAKSTRRHKHRHRHAKDTAQDGFTLFVADANGDLQNAGPLKQETYDDYGGDGSNDPGYGCDPFSGQGFIVVVLFMPTDGSFDLASFLDGLMNGTFDPSTFDFAGDGTATR